MPIGTNIQTCTSNVYEHPTVAYTLNQINHSESQSLRTLAQALLTGNDFSCRGELYYSFIYLTKAQNSIHIRFHLCRSSCDSVAGPKRISDGYRRICQRGRSVGGTHLKLSPPLYNYAYIILKQKKTYRLKKKNILTRRHKRRQIKLLNFWSMHFYKRRSHIP